MTVTPEIDLLHTHITDLLTAWTDSDNIQHPGLHLMLERHLRIGPTHMDDDKPYAKSKIPAGPAPWDDAIAHLLADISSGARTIERGLDLAVGNTLRRRGGSDGNTRHALSRLPDLTHRATQLPHHEDLIAEVRITVGSWHRGALLLLGAERRWAHIRSYDDSQEARDSNHGLPVPIVAACPYCEHPVRIRPDLADAGDPHRADGHDCNVLHCDTRSPAAVRGDQPASAWCVNPGCIDDTGYRRSWPVDPWLGTLVTWQPEKTATHRGSQVA